ncbi:MAG: lipoyl(octanoyl) transferase LipB [Mucinivorans sp.]
MIEGTKIEVEKIDVGRMSYIEAWAMQRERFDALIAHRQASALIFVEHPHVYTLGKSGVENNLLINASFLEKIGATFVHVDRGGDITYHGPGQMVVYPILDLVALNISLRDYIYRLEESIIGTLAEFGITAGRSVGATGVWIDNTRKIAAIGVRASHSVTMHGAALNVTTDLNYFSHINPCGFTDRGVSSIAAEMARYGREDGVKMQDVKDVFCRKFTEQFACKII